jgi:hypothetical protein
MKVIVLDEPTWALVTKKLEQELACSEFEYQRLRYWQRKHRCQYVSAKWIRKRHIEAIRLCRRILSQ